MAYIFKIVKKILSNKLWLAIAVFILLGGGYYGYTKFFSNSGEIRYIAAQARKGTLVVSISGSGQVSVSNQIDIKPKVSGEVVYVGVENGEAVKAGALIAQLDIRDAQKTVRDAELNLENVRLTLEEMKGKKGDDYTLRSITEKAKDNLKKDYEDGFNIVASVFIDLPTIMIGLQDTLFSSTLNISQWNIDYYADAVQQYDSAALSFRDDVYLKFRDARKAYDQNFLDYKSVSRFSDTLTIEHLINQTYDTTKNVADYLKSANNLIQFYQEKLTERSLRLNSLSNTHLSNINNYTGKTNTHLLNLLSIKNGIQTDKEAIVGSDFDVASQELAVKQKENALLDAKEKLDDYYIRAPFNGVIAKTNLKKGDSVSSASVLATLITRQKIAEISLNEVDVAQVKIGQKTTLVFDAIPNFTITGQVAEIDAVGTVSQGVVTYTVKIAFDTQDDRIKPGMSVSAAIVIEAKSNALLVPNSAIKSQGGINYAEIIGDDDKNAALAANSSGAILKNSPRQQRVEIGLSNDEFTEIVRGLQEGDAVVTRIIQSTSQAAQTQQSSSIRIPGLPTGGSQIRTR